MSATSWDLPATSLRPPCDLLATSLRPPFDLLSTSSLPPQLYFGGPIKFEIYQLDAGSTEIPLDPAIFYSDTTATHIDVQTYDYGKTGLYSLRLKVFHDAYPSVVFDRDFLVEI